MWFMKYWWSSKVDLSFCLWIQWSWSFLNKIRVLFKFMVFSMIEFSLSCEENLIHDTIAFTCHTFRNWYSIIDVLMRTRVIHGRRSRIPCSISRFFAINRMLGFQLSLSTCLCIEAHSLFEKARIIWAIFSKHVVTILDWVLRYNRPDCHWKLSLIPSGELVDFVF